MTQEDYKQMRRDKTKESAVALLDDIEFFRSILHKEKITSGEARRMSAQLRRLIVEEGIKKIAAPRIGKIEIVSPDTSKLIAYNKKQPFSFLGTGHVGVFGIYVAYFMIEKANSPRQLDLNPDSTTALSLEHFAKQGVMIFEGEWITRTEIIRFIANIADGIHSGEKMNDREKLIRRARSISKIHLDEDIPTITSDTDLFTSNTIPDLIDRTKLDWLLIELLAAANFLINSPDIQRLEEYIVKEIQD